MSFKVTKFISRSPVGGSVNEYVCSEEADISKLPRVGIQGTQTGDGSAIDNSPCWYGSIATLCTETSTSEYILAPTNKWVKKSQISGGSSSGSSDNTMLVSIDGVNYAIGNMSDPEATGEDNTYSTEIELN